MFGERDKFADEIEQLLELYSIEEALEIMDITHEEVLSILLNGGHVSLPPFVSRESETYYDEQ